MKLALALFWRRSWDNLGHLVLLNLIWFVLLIPFFFSAYNLINVVYPRETAATEETSEVNMEGTRAIEESATPSSDASLAAQSTDGALTPRKRGDFRWSSRAAGALLLLAMSWAVVCAATGFVYYGMADIVTEYDFGGYRFLIRTYLKRGPILKTIAAMTFFAATFIASMTNMFFYLTVAQTKGPVFLILAGVMLWFILFLSMTGALTLPVMAQRDLKAAYEMEAAAVGGAAGDARPEANKDAGLLKSARTAAVLALSAPLATFVVLTIASLIMFVGIFSMAGVGFFAVAAPAALFNAYAFVQLGGTIRWSPEESAPSLYGTAN